MRISATIITLNEERNIERCIRSLTGVVDEILVLDAFSSDRTKEICQNQDVQFRQRKWEGYAESKNYLNSLATGDYILSIDADEALDETLRNAILELKSNEHPQVYALNRMTNYCGRWIKHSGWYPDIKVRLFPKIGSAWKGEFVHEEIHVPKDLEVILLAGHLEHYSYYSFEDHRKRADKYSSLTAQKFHKLGKKASVFKPYLSGLGRFISMYFLKSGFRDGQMGFKIAWISAQSNIFKYRELRRLNKIGKS